MWKKFKEDRLKVFENALKRNKIDEGITALAKKINKNENLVTTSSCFGRIVFLGSDITSRKKTAEFYKKWHKSADLEEVELAAASYTGKLPLWFMVEPFTLQVSAKDFKSAESFMSKMRKAGVKRGGIQGTSKGRIVIELQGSAGMAVPVYLVDCRWDELVGLANRMMETNSKQIKKLEKIKW